MAGGVGGEKGHDFGDIFHLAEAPRPATATLAEDALTIVWAGEEHTSTYPLSFLAQYAEGKRRADPADLPRRADLGLAPLA